MADWMPADLHVHTALSACAGAEMTPPAILLTAERRGVRVLGVVDHCTARNARVVLSAAEAFEVRVFVGLEIETVEGVHILTLFDDAEAAMDMDSAVADRLPNRPNREDVFGEQHLLNEWGDEIGRDERLLQTAAELTLQQVAGMAAARDGVSIPAHIDRFPNGLLPVLGFVPPGLEVELLEVSAHMGREEARRRWPELSGRALVTGSDAHYIDDIGRGVSAVPAELVAAAGPARRWGSLLAGAVLSQGY